jgi:hypothetical protein
MKHKTYCTKFKVRKQRMSGLILARRVLVRRAGNRKDYWSSFAASRWARMDSAAVRFRRTFVRLGTGGVSRSMFGKFTVMLGIAATGCVCVTGCSPRSASERLVSSLGLLGFSANQLNGLTNCNQAQPGTNLAINVPSAQKRNARAIETPTPEIIPKLLNQWPMRAINETWGASR